MVEKVAQTLTNAEQQDDNVVEPYLNLPFRHNYLHDVESLWWIAMWAFFTTRPRSPPHVQRSKIMDRIFPHSLDNISGRILFFISEDNREYTKDLPGAFRGSIKTLNGIRLLLRVLYQHFRELAMGTSTEEIPFGVMYRTVIAKFNTAADSAIGDLEMIPTSTGMESTQGGESRGMKRHLGSGNDDGDEEMDVTTSKRSKKVR